MQVPHKDRIACFAPCRRLSTALLSTLQTWYLRGKGGYNEVAVGTINAATNGTFGTASLVCVCVCGGRPGWCMCLCMTVVGWRKAGFRRR